MPLRSYRFLSTIAATAERRFGSASKESPFQWYTRMLDRQPLLTKALTGGAIAGGGDALCQVAIERKKWDAWRTMRFCFLGTFFVAPTSHYFYDFLARRYTTSNLDIVKRVVWDQFVWSPVFYVIWLSGLWTMEGAQPHHLPDRLSDHMGHVLVANWIVWIPAQALNFKLLPAKFHVLFTNVVELVWNAYLSYTATDKKH